MKKIVVLDIETTGFLGQGGSIIEIGMVELDLDSGEIKPLFDSLCREDILDESHTTGRMGWIFRNSNLKYEELLKAPKFEDVKIKVQEILNIYQLGATAFNKDFDFNFLRNRGLEIKDLACPMKLATDICQLPNRNGYSGYKWPSATEAYNHFYPEETEYIEAHRGLSDAIDEAKIVQKLYEIGKFIV